MQHRALMAGGALALGLFVWACDRAPDGPALPQSASDFAAASTCQVPPSTPVQVKGGSFVMGSDAVYAEEGPPRETQVDGFWIDSHEVTNRQFAEFVGATGHITVAEKPVDPAQFGVPLEQIPDYMRKP